MDANQEQTQVHTQATPGQPTLQRYRCSHCKHFVPYKNAHRNPNEYDEFICDEPVYDYCCFHGNRAECGCK